MKSGLTPLFSMDDVTQWFDHFQYRAEEKLFKLLQAAGEMFVKYARESGKYYDHTGNLRSSIGYVIVVDGEELTADFGESGKGTDRGTGKGKGGKLAREVAASYPNGFVLVGVAGMEYAVYVEAIEGKDVISSANIQMEEWLRKSLQTVFSKM